MRIASLLPSATEIVFALGAGPELVAISEKCDYPAEAAGRRVVVRARLDDSQPQAEIDAQVNRLLAAGESLYEVDTDALTHLQCDLVLTQDVCHVCAASPADLAAAMERGQCPARVLSLHPMGLDDVWLDIERIGVAVGREPQARALAEALRARTQSPMAVPGPRPRVLCLEWFDPPFVAGHWVPEMVERAGGLDVLGVAREPGYRCSWQRILESDPDLIVLMPCGYHLDQVEQQARGFAWPPAWNGLRAVRGGQVYLVDASGQFSRHGPRLADGVQTLQEVMAQYQTPGSSTASQSNWRRWSAQVV
ncbi:MAG: ABC transporter substrate-binding protein [Terriglobales bacterium]